MTALSWDLKTSVMKAEASVEGGKKTELVVTARQEEVLVEMRSRAKQRLVPKVEGDMPPAAKKEKAQAQAQAAAPLPFQRQWRGRGRQRSCRRQHLRTRKQKSRPRAPTISYFTSSAEGEGGGGMALEATNGARAAKRTFNSRRSIARAATSLHLRR